jgi:hypothetical protein
MTPGIDWFGLVEACAVVGVTVVGACLLKARSRAGSQKEPSGAANVPSRGDRARENDADTARSTPAAPTDKTPWKAGQKQ